MQLTNISKQSKSYELKLLSEQKNKNIFAVIFFLNYFQIELFSSFYAIFYYSILLFFDSRLGNIIGLIAKIMKQYE